MNKTIGPTRLVLINSGGCGYAELPIDRSLHIIARNNYGKTSIINALQYFYVEHGHGYRFPKGNSPKASHRHYFPADTSYVLVECRTLSGTIVHGIRGLGPATDYDRQRFVCTGPFRREDYLDERARPRKWDDLETVLGDRLTNAAITAPDAIAMMTGKDQGGKVVLPLKDSIPYSHFRSAMINFLNLNNMTGADLRDLVVATTRHEGLQEEIDIRGAYADIFHKAQAEKNKAELLQEKLPQIQDMRALINRRLELLSRAADLHAGLTLGIERATAAITSSLEGANVDIADIDREETERKDERRRVDKLRSDEEYETRTLDGELSGLDQLRQRLSASGGPDEADRDVDAAFATHLEAADRERRLAGRDEAWGRARVEAARRFLNDTEKRDLILAEIARSAFERAQADLQWIVGDPEKAATAAREGRDAAMRRWLDHETLASAEADMADKVMARKQHADARDAYDKRLKEIDTALETMQKTRRKLVDANIGLDNQLAKLVEDRAALPAAIPDAPPATTVEAVAHSRIRPRLQELAGMLAECANMRATIERTCPDLDAAGVRLDTDVNMLRQLTSAEEVAANRVGAAENAWMTLAGSMRTDVRRLADSLNSIHRRVGEINKAIAKVQISDLETVRLVVAENVTRMKDVNDFLNGTDDDGRARGAAAKRITEIIEKGRWSLTDLFNIELQVVKDGETKHYADLSNIQSNGTAIMIKLTVGFAIIGSMMRDDVRFSFPFYVDEINALDSENIAEILAFSRERGAVPLVSSPHVFDVDDIETICKPPPKQNRRIVIDPYYHLALTRKPPAASIQA